MNRVVRIAPKFVDIIPEQLEEGILYVSRRYATASHLCCCGCGLEVVTPINPAKWRLVERADTVSLWPSIGNWSFPCQSHYYIERNGVRWAGSFSPKMIAAVKARDRLDVLNRGERVSKIKLTARYAGQLWSAATDRLRRWLRGS